MKRPQTRPCAQVLADLVRNAVRHTPEGGLVAVRARRHDDRFAEITVEDTGDGIPAEELRRVFERFYRADPSCLEAARSDTTFTDR